MNALLQVGDRTVTTPFGLVGTDENALTFALAFTFQQCPAFLREFLRSIGIDGVRVSSLRNVRIAVQKRTGGDGQEGITDIELHLPGHFHVIIEAKVGFNVPQIEQCQKYLQRLQKEPIQRLVAVIQTPFAAFVEAYAIENTAFTDVLMAFRWMDLIPSCIRLLYSDSISQDEKYWLGAFHRFLDEEYKMRAFSTEVWILAINTKPLWKDGSSHWDIHQRHQVWWDYRDHTVRPLYFAFRVDGKVDAIYRVTHISHHVPMIEVAPELANVRAKWPHIPATVWHFDKATTLKPPLRTGPGMYNRRVRCDLDLLLSCTTVLEVEQKMAERRQLGDD